MVYFTSCAGQVFAVGEDEDWGKYVRVRSAGDIDAVYYGIEDVKVRAGETVAAAEAETEQEAAETETAENKYRPTDMTTASAGASDTGSRGTSSGGPGRQKDSGRSNRSQHASCHRSTRNLQSMTW